MYVVREMYVGLSERRGNPEDDFRNAQLYKNKIEKLKPITMQQYEYTNKIYYDHFVLPFTIGWSCYWGTCVWDTTSGSRAFRKKNVKKFAKACSALKPFVPAGKFSGKVCCITIYSKRTRCWDTCTWPLLSDGSCWLLSGKSNLWFIIPVLSTHLISLSFSVISIRQKRHSRTASFSLLDGLDTDVPVNRDLTGCHQTFLLPYFRHEEDHETTGLRFAYTNRTLAHFPGTFSGRKFHKRPEWWG